MFEHQCPECGAQAEPLKSEPFKLCPECHTVMAYIGEKEEQEE
ncbi:hypothetical protein [Pseudalkalibacillus caeni]|nr:hypothetical protein [Pseudalkalibacillus caeni]